MHQRPLLFIFCALFFFSSSSHAGKVLKTNGKKVYIIFSQEEDGTFATDDIFYITDNDGKKKGLVQLKKVKGLKAVAILGKGNANKNDNTLFKDAGKKTKKSKSAENSQVSSREDYDKKSLRKNKHVSRWGILVDYETVKQDVNQGNSTSAQTGSSLGFRGAYSLPVTDSIEIHLMAGMEMFKVEGQGLMPNLLSTGTIGTDIKYLAVDGLLKWEIAGGENFGLKLIGGVGIFHPLSSSSTAISSIATIASGEFGLGAEYRTSSFSIPFDFIYYYFPAGGDVSTKMMGVRTGVYF